MTFPISNYSRIWVRGRFVDLGKAAREEESYGLAGKVTFTPSPKVLLDAGTRQIISTAAFTVTTEAQDGYFQVHLPATDDPDINPTSWTYAVSEPTGRSYNIIVPVDTPVLNSPGDPLHGQQVIDLITVVPAPPAGAGSVQLLPGADGRGIASMTVDGSGELVVTYDDDATANLGPITAVSIAESINVVAAAGTTETLPSPAVATIHDLTLSAASCALTLPAPVAGSTLTVFLRQDATGGRAVTWPGTVVWPFGVPPTLAAAAGSVDEVSLVAPTGAAWLGTHNATYPA